MGSAWQSNACTCRSPAVCLLGVLTRLHSVLSAFQSTTEAVVFKNILNPTYAVHTRHSDSSRACDDATVSQSPKDLHLCNVIGRLFEVTASSRSGIGQELIDESNAYVVTPAKHAAPKFKQFIAANNMMQPDDACSC